jgi:Sulfotransferase domain
MKPNLIIIGAMKAGTTSLHAYLNAHRDVTMSEPKELNFFSNPKFWNKGVEWYERHFSEDVKVRGETSTSYTVHPAISGVPERMASIVPDTRIIYLVRHPVRRLLSQYVHRLSEGGERRTLTTIVEQAEQGERYIFQSLYFAQLREYLRYFSKDQILVISTENLKGRREQTLREVCQFLELSYEFGDGAFSKEHNVSEDYSLYRNWWVNLVYPAWIQTHARLPWKVRLPFHHLARLHTKPIEKPELRDEDERILKEHFRPDVEQLRRLTGKTFDEWRDL